MLMCELDVMEYRDVVESRLLEEFFEGDLEEVEGEDDESSEFALIYFEGDDDEYEEFLKELFQIRG